MNILKVCKHMQVFYSCHCDMKYLSDQYEILFFDGVVKVLRSTALTKVDPKVCYFQNDNSSLTILLSTLTSVP